jgi:hypothetical protein
MSSAATGGDQSWAISRPLCGYEIDEIERELRAGGASHPYVSLLQPEPGVAWVLSCAIASEIGDISRFASPKKLVGYTGLTPYVNQSGGHDWRGPLVTNGTKYLRWTTRRGATHAAHHVYRDHHERTKARIGCQRGAEVVGEHAPNGVGELVRRGRTSLRQGPTLTLAA